MTASDEGTLDFFVSYTSADSDWAEWIAWQLEAAGYSVVIQKWDFKPGSNFVFEMDRASKVAMRTLVVLSPSFIASQFTQPEWNAAFAKDPTGRNRNVVPVLIEPTELDGLLSQIVHVDLVGLGRDDAALKLIAAIEPGRSKPTTEPQFPGSREQAKGRAQETREQASEPESPRTAGLDWQPAPTGLSMINREEVLPRHSAPSGFACLEIALVPGEPTALLVGQLETASVELVDAARAAGLFTQTAGVENGYDANAAYATSRATQETDPAGLLVTRNGQRSAWLTLPHDMLGSVLDPAQMRARVARVLQLLVSLNLPIASRYGITARIQPARSVIIADASVVGARSSASMNIDSASAFPLTMPDTVRGEGIAANTEALAAELIARVATALRR